MKASPSGSEFQAISKCRQGDAANVVFTDRRLQFTPRAGMAEGSTAPNPARPIAGICTRAGSHMGFSTAD